MAYYRKYKAAINDKWYPRTVLSGKPVSTEQVAKRLAAESTVSLSDVRAVLSGLTSVLGEYMAQGRSVRLEGIGTFHFRLTASGNGVDTADEVSPDQINGVKVRFTPETTFKRTGHGRTATRALTDVEIEWIDVDTFSKTAAAKADPDNEVQQPGTDTGGGDLEF